MLIRTSTWQLIREQFSEDEKSELNEAYAGETICPRGIVVDEQRLPLDVKTKLITAVAGVK